MGENFIIRDDVPYYKSTLAHLLDTRRISLEEPSASNLPSEVNPLELVMSLLGAHVTVVRVKDECTRGDLMSCLGKLKSFMRTGEALKVVRCLEKQDDLLMRSSMDESFHVSEVCRFTDDFQKENLDG